MTLQKGRGAGLVLLGVLLVGRTKADLICREVQL